MPPKRKDFGLPQSRTKKSKDEKAAPAMCEYNALSSFDLDSAIYPRSTDAKKKKKSNEKAEKEKIALFNSSRLKFCYSKLDLNFYAEVLAENFQKDALARAAAEAHEEGEQKDWKTKRDIILYLITKPIFVEKERGEWKIVINKQAYKEYFDSEIPPLPNPDTEVESSTLDEGNDNLSELQRIRKREEEKDRLIALRLELDEKLDKMNREAEREAHIKDRHKVISGENKHTRTLRPSQAQHTGIEAKTGGGRQNIVRTGLTMAAKDTSTSEKKEETVTTEEDKATKILNSGVMKKFRDFAMLSKQDQRKILSFEYVDMLKIIATQDDIRSDPKTKEIFPGLQVMTKTDRLQGKGFGPQGLMQGLWVLIKWYSACYPEKVPMIVEFQDNISKYLRAQYTFPQLVSYTEYIRKNSTGPDANWADKQIETEAFRLHLNIGRERRSFITNRPIYPERERFPASSDRYYGNNFRGGFRGRGGRGRGRPMCRFFEKGEKCRFIENGYCRFSHRKEGSRGGRGRGDRNRS